MLDGTLQRIVAAIVPQLPTPSGSLDFDFMLPHLNGRDKDWQPRGHALQSRKFQKTKEGDSDELDNSRPVRRARTNGPNLSADVPLLRRTDEILRTHRHGTGL